MGLNLDFIIETEAIIWSLLFICIMVCTISIVKAEVIIKKKKPNRRNKK